MRSFQVPFGTPKIPASQENSVIHVLCKEIQESVIGVIYGIPNPATDLPEGIEYPAQFDAHAPAIFILFLSRIGAPITFRGWGKSVQWDNYITAQRRISNTLYEKWHMGNTISIKVISAFFYISELSEYDKFNGGWLAYLE